MFKFLPIGGVGYIGGNLSYLEIHQDAYLIDTGILFPREQSLGIDHLYPNLDMIKKDFRTPEYLILTHCHEDHVGGINHLVKVFPKIKIICSSYSALFISEKLPKIKNQIIHYKDFNNKSFKFFKLRHSIPGVVGFNLYLEELNLNILFCTDFRYDSDEKDIRYLNKDMITGFEAAKNKWFFVDSTNIDSSKDSGPLEQDLVSNMRKDIEACKQDIYLTTFPSNTERLNTIIKICNSLNKPVLLNGLSVKFNYSLGLKAGLIEPIKESKYIKGESLVILSGSQGDLRGAFRRVFSGNDKSYKPMLGDNLLYSSKIIPGNEREVNELFNKASLLGVSINKGSSPFIHASGHAYKDEIKEIIDLYAPTNIFPIHLESSFFESFYRKLCSKKYEIHRLINFSLLESSAKTALKITALQELELKIISDGGREIEKGEINNRRRLGNTGVVFVSFSKSPGTNPVISSYGLPEYNTSALNSEISSLVTQHWKSPNISEEVRIGLRSFLSKIVGYKPLVFVHFLQ